MRYDLYRRTRRRSPMRRRPDSQEFNIDKNNFGPRVGVAWPLDAARTVVRARARASCTTSRCSASTSRRLQHGDPPQLTSVYGSRGRRAARPRSRRAWRRRHRTSCRSSRLGGVVRDFGWRSDVAEQRAGRAGAARGHDGVAVGDVNSNGQQAAGGDQHQPDQPDRATLADGRPIFSTAGTPSTRLDPRFNHIRRVQSIGESTYKSLTASVTKRMTHGLAGPGAPTRSARGWTTRRSLAQLRVAVRTTGCPTRPTSIATAGPTRSTIRHTLRTATSSSRRTIVGRRPGRRQSLNGNQIGVHAARSTAACRSTSGRNRDLNNDGMLSDRPIGVARNAAVPGRRVKNVDLRYSRFIPIAARRAAEMFVEAKNVFNAENISRRQPRSSPTDAAGNPVAAIPADRTIRQAERL